MKEGELVEFPVDCGIFVVGEVIGYNENSGQITVKDAEGMVWKGCESQILLVEDDRICIKDKTQSQRIK